jgi:hypothetical protein
MQALSSKETPMAEKQLTESAWKAHAKGRSYKDASLIKALADWGRADSAHLDDQLLSLDAIEKAAAELLKENKGDKELVAYLAELNKATARTRKVAELAAKESAKESARETVKPEDDDESVAVLTTKMLPLLRQVAKGDVMHTMLASAGKQLVVLLSRKPIPVSRRKLLADQLESTGGTKYFNGICQLEQNATTFVLTTEVAGLAKRIKAALLQQTGLRVKVRCRSEDGQTDDDGEDEEGAALAHGAPTQATPGHAKPAAVGGGVSLVQLGKVRLEWNQTRGHAVSELTRLKSILQREYRDATDEQAALVKALRRVDDTISAMDEELSRQLDQVLNAPAAKRPELAAAAKATLRRIASRLGSDEVLLSIDGNELAPEMKVAAPLRAKLTEIVAFLG